VRGRVGRILHPESLRFGCGRSGIRLPGPEGEADQENGGGELAADSYASGDDQDLDALGGGRGVEGERKDPVDEITQNHAKLGRHPVMEVLLNRYVRKSRGSCNLIKSLLTFNFQLL
jgi:hypothetical protein